MIRILVADKLADVGVQRLKEADDVEVEIKPGLSEEQLRDTVGAFDGMIIRSGVKVSKTALSNPGKLRGIARAGVGVDNVDLEAATAAGILVMNTPGANTLATAEHTLAMMLSLARHLPAAHAHVTSGEWNRAAYVGTQLSEKTLGLVGVGRVGREVAKRALAFEMKVIAFDPFVKEKTLLDGGVTMVGTLEELLKASDYISMHAAVTDETKGMIGKEQLAMMKPTARFINCARGVLVDQQALTDALNEGRIAGAAIDVYPAEPPVDNPLLKAKNVVLAPHLGASTKEAQLAVATEAVDVLLAWLRDGKKISPVNKLP